MSKTIASHCDTRCQYADPDKIENCDCECAGKNHGQGTDIRIWETKKARLNSTRKAFRKFLNAQVKGSGSKLYRKNRAEFDKQYLLWKNGDSLGTAPNGEELVLEKPITTVHQSGSEVTIIKDQEFEGNTYSHVRRSNGKTEYRKNDKLITKKGVPTELGW